MQAPIVAATIYVVTIDLDALLVVTRSTLTLRTVGTLRCCFDALVDVPQVADVELVVVELRRILVVASAAATGAEAADAADDLQNVRTATAAAATGQLVGLLRDAATSGRGLVVVVVVSSRGRCVAVG